MGFSVEISPGVTLHTLPRHVSKWDDFVASAPPYSIALDGFVYGRPRFEAAGPYLNLNHHEEVDRLGTRCTCAQVFISLKQGLLETFSANGKPHMNIFVNDPDQDTCLAVWLLARSTAMPASVQERRVNRLVNIEDLLDTTAGAYCLDPSSSIMRQIGWVFEPYSSLRSAGRIGSLSAAEMSALILEVCGRIDEHVAGRGGEVDLETGYSVVGGGQGWALIREESPYARTALYQSGTKAFVSVQDLPDGRFKYSIGKMSPFVRFPIDRIYDALNKAEGILPGSLDSWGGSDTIGGSPRSGHSKLSPAEIQAAIEATLAGSAFDA